MFLNQLKYLSILILTLLLGSQNTYAKTELVLPQFQSSFSFEHSQKTNSLKKDLQPNIGFLKEKTTFEVSEGFSAWNSHKYLDSDVLPFGQCGGKI